MIRTCTVFAALALAAGLSQAGQERPAPKKGDVVKQLQKDFDDARARLQQDDAGEKTRAAHRRIIAGIDRLLQQEDDPGAGPPPQAPTGSTPPKPMNQSAPKAKPMAEGPSSPKVRPLPGDQPAERPGVGPAGPWDPRRKVQADAVDAVGRERFPPRYEELLRAYYRSLAAGRGEEP